MRAHAPPEMVGPPRDEAEVDSSSMITEEAVADVFARRHLGLARFCHQTGRWYLWNAAVSIQDQTEIVFDRLRSITRELSQSDRRDRGVTRRAAFARGAEAFARSDRRLAVAAEVWDQDAFLLDTPTGTVDLRTGTLREGRSEEGITRSTAVVPSEEAQCPRWLKFLNETFPDPGTVAFVQRYIGYCLTGDTREHVFVFAWGSGGNGKSVLINLLSRTLGTYTAIAPLDMFAATKGERHPTGLARLKGIRFRRHRD